MNGAGEAFPRCAVCSQPAAQQCGGCRSEHYCGRTHQKQAWRAGHRLKCSSFRLDTNDILGRHLVATRDIKQGEVILKEKPAVLGPKIACFPTCLACYKQLRPTKTQSGIYEYYKCASCTWPMCGPACQASIVHKEECELMTERKYQSIITFSGEQRKESAYCVLTPLRCLLLQKSNPKQYEAIMSLESHVEERINSLLYKILKANLVTFMQQVMGLTQFDEETILKVAGILDTNAYDIRNNNDQKRLRGIYLTASMRAHDCNPNTKHVFIDDAFCMAVMATNFIPKGGILTMSYTQPIWGTLSRRLHLQSTKCFECHCERCKDPTEYGTYLGAINCSHCTPKSPTGDLDKFPKLLSVNPLDNLADWKCQKCNHKIQAKQMTWGNDAIRKDILRLDKSNPRDFEEFLEKYKQTLHPTNYHVIEIKYALAQMYGCIPGFSYNELNDAGLNRKISICYELLDIFTLIQPGWTRSRGTLLLELQSALVVRSKRELATTQITKSAAQDQLGDCMAMLQEASDILRSEPDMQDVLKKRLESLAQELNDGEYENVKEPLD